MKRLVALLALVSLSAACEDSTAPDVADPPLEPSFQSLESGQEVVPDRYIIRLAEQVGNVEEFARSVTASGGAVLHHVYRHAFHGFAATFPPQAVEALRRNPNVVSVDPDIMVHAVGTVSEPTVLWGLDRIDQETSTDGFYTYDATGLDVHAYILDTGIRTDHVQFGGRAHIAFDAVGDGQNGVDCNGHGTHVAGTIGGIEYGVAKEVQLHAVRVLDCSGSGLSSTIVAGIDWVTGNHESPAVANMSLSGYWLWGMLGIDSPIDVAVKNSIASGVSYALAASNDNDDACLYTPARTPEGMTVGATDQSDSRASFSNWGSCVDWFAPGVSILSAYHTSTTASATASGTSMAAPHTAGVAALYLETNRNATPAQVTQALENALSTGVVQNAASANNHLLHSRFSEVPANLRPTADFTFAISGLEVTFTDASSDSDGSVVARSWDFGDESGTSTEQNPIYTYAAAGTYSVTLTVTDDDGATDAVTKAVTVTSAPLPVPVLTAERYKRNKVILDWVPVEMTVDIWRTLLGDPSTTIVVGYGVDGGHYTDSVRPKGTYWYWVCQAGNPDNCSAPATIIF
ncbi:MAG: S8 family serine peptidase [Gemmatimonadota bacterium]|jgi:subtilisin family serine protease